MTSASELDSHFARGVAWTGISRLATQVVSWAAFVAIARILAPTDFGIVAATTSTVGLVALVTEFGLGTAIVARAAIDQHELEFLAGVAAAMGIVAALTCVLLAQPVAAALGVPQLRLVFPVVGITIGLTTLNAVPTAVMRRGLAFRRLSQLEIVRALVSTGSVLSLALFGFRFWAPILGELIATVAMTAMLFRTTLLRVRVPQRAQVTGSLTFSRDVLLSRAAWYAYSNADFMVVGRRLGTAVLGDYSMAWTLINLPSEKVATLLFAVTPSVFARVREDLNEFRRYVLLLVESLSLVLMPMSAGLGLLAPDLVAVVLGPKWKEAVPLIQALAFFAVVKSVSPLSAQILVSRGNAALAKRQSFRSLIILPAAFLLASRYGAFAVALVWTIVKPILVAIEIREAAHEIELPMGDLLRRVVPIGGATATMAVVVWGFLHGTVLPVMPPAVRLGCGTALGAAVYATVLWLAARERILTTIRFVRNGRGGAALRADTATQGAAS